MVVVVPEPVVVAPPGLALTVHVPEAGKPLRSTLPVGVVQSGSVTVPTTGEVGTIGAALIVAFNEAADVQPLLSVMVKEYVLGFKELNVADVPEPVCVTPPGEAAIVHEPDAGSPLKATDPVEVLQSGWVIVPINGAEGQEGTVFIAAFVDALEVQEKLLETVKE